ncbi:unnamed protein product [Clonostachys byssicola]|uniref:Alpha/beta hydrolase fold-3 domain-containing protein n=1 Tax=Clonostachys byssicola TaxID=160290 RepID=A0A9N9UZR9_9HYPO|nr:unnamed protein product [Clonostachys byssicola]
MATKTNASNKAQQAVSWSRSCVLRSQRLFHQSLTNHGLPYLRRQKPDFWTARQPTKIFEYPQHPGLGIRLFKPEGCTDKPAPPNGWPIVFMIHGGGWTIGNAEMDDEQAHILSTKYGFCVMGLEYGLSPARRFPGPIQDLAGLIECAIGDTKLVSEFNLDTSKVSLVGFSCGGSLALSLAQLPALQKKIHAIVAFYPLVDFVGLFHEDGPARKTPWGKADPLPSVLPMYTWSYVPVGQDLEDPLLSPWYAAREAIPQPLFIITADDCLREEGCMFARKAAGLDLNVNPHEVSTESWEVESVRYEFVPGMPHCFPHFWEEIKGSDEWEKKRLDINKRIWSEVAAWLKAKLEL